MNHREAIFTFGSNLGGFHGAGAAKFALTHKGATLYVPVGRQGQSYAIPTKDEFIKNTLPLQDIKWYVEQFLVYAQKHMELEFQITCIGCGLAGLKHKDIAPMFHLHTTNCWFDEAWKPYLPENTKFWGTF